MKTKKILFGIEDFKKEKKTTKETESFRNCFRISIAVKRHCDHNNSYKRKHLIRAGLQFGGSVPYHHGRKHAASRLVSCWRRN